MGQPQALLCPFPLRFLRPALCVIGDDVDIDIDEGDDVDIDEEDEVSSSVNPPPRLECFILTQIGHPQALLCPFFFFPPICAVGYVLKELLEIVLVIFIYYSNISFSKNRIIILFFEINFLNTKYKRLMMLIYICILFS
jgi:hypothetical protein